MMIQVRFYYFVWLGVLVVWVVVIVLVVVVEMFDVLQQIVIDEKVVFVIVESISVVLVCGCIGGIVV